MVPSPSGAPPTENDLHVLVTGETQTQVDTAVEEIKKHNLFRHHAR